MTNVKMSEAAVASHVLLESANCGDQLWRNNNGACVDQTGRQIRYGLCNESKALSDKIKSSDYIGITSVVITPDMVGQTIGVFTAVETKPSDWVFPQPTNQAEFKRAIAQKAFHDIVNAAGGRAGFARNAGEYRLIVRK